MAKPKGKLSVACDQELIDLIKFVADKQGVQFSDWVRNAVTSALPKNAKSVMEGSDQQFTAVEVAHALADAREGETVKITVPLQNELPRTDGMIRPETHRPGVPNHPCGWLKAEWNPPFDRRTCNGTCYAPPQKGKACFFNPMTAQQCPAFSRKT